MEALRRAGCVVFQIDARDIADLLVGFRGQWWALEVKQPLGPEGGASKDGQHLSPGQEAFFALCRDLRLPAAVVRTPEEALRAIGAIP